MTVYTVSGVHDRKEWSGNFGPMVTYVLDVTDETGHKAMDVELNRKPESREPEEGERFVGHLESGKFGEKLKIDFEATKELNRGGGHREASTSNTSKPASSKGDVDWDAKEARIMRQAVLKIIAPMIHAKGDLTLDLKRVCEEIEDFIVAAPSRPLDQKASQGAGAGTGEGGSPRPFSDPVRKAPPPEEAPKDTHWWLSNLLEQGGASSHAAGILANFALEELSPENLKKCEALLSNLDSQVDGRERLEKSYVKAHGPLPTREELDEDIPFHHPEYPEFGFERLRWRF